MFTINVNGTELHFGIKEFAIVTGLKCGGNNDFLSDSAIPKRLIELYTTLFREIYSDQIEVRGCIHNQLIFIRF